jgi:hypothetical protein
MSFTPPTPPALKTPKKAKYPAGSYFTQKSGPRAGQQYQVKKGLSGLSIAKYRSGDTAIAETDRGVNVAAQKRDVAARKTAFTQQSGPRSGQKFRVKRGKSGKNVRIYTSGDTATQ